MCLGWPGFPGWPGPVGGAGAPGRGGCFRLGGGGPDEPGRQRWTITVVPAQVATTALDRHCRPDDSTHYFAVVGGARGSQASARSNLPKPLKPADMGTHADGQCKDPTGLSALIYVNIFGEYA